MGHVIDRRLDGRNKSAVNRQRFIRRFRSQLKKAVEQAMSGRSITDMDSGEQVKIPSRDLSEPTFSHGRGGLRETVHPGNREFVTGDRLSRPQGSSGGGGGGGGKAGRGTGGEDEFVFQLSREEFLDLFFEDLELPNMVQTQLTRLTETRFVRAGVSTAGLPTNINVVRSMRQALARRIALAAPYRSRLRAMEKELQEMEASAGDDGGRREQLQQECRRLRHRIRAVPFLDTIDLRYNLRVPRPQPSNQAVMFCLMDVSGSMDQSRKDLAKRFFTLLYLFLKRNYERIDVVFIRHHTVAKEVDEEEFFYSRETGGTVVSSALQLMHEIAARRYPVSSWNIYAAQASDGDNWHDDSPRCRELLVEKLLPLTRYYAYVEITPTRHQSLWQEYRSVAEDCPQFAMRRIDGPSDIYPVFRELFRKRAAA